MKQTWQQRSGWLGMAVVLAWLTWATPVLWTACTAMTLQAVGPGCCQTAVPHCQRGQGMSAGCMLQLTAAGHYLPSTQTGVNSAPAATLPPTPVVLHNFESTAFSAPFADVPPPPRTRRLNLYFGVFLK